MRPDIRQEDVEEWSAGTALPFTATVSSVLEEPGGDVLAVFDEDSGDCYCIWGCYRKDQENRVWLIATNAAVPRAVPLHRLLKPQLQALHDRYGDLWAYPHVNNEVHHVWLNWLGFHQEPGTYLFGPLEAPFLKFKRRNPCASD